MNKLVLIALRRPYTFIVLSILIVTFGILSVLETPTDVFPNIKIPVTSVVWTYGGLLPEDMEGRITYVFERALTSTVEGMKYIHSHSYFGSSVINIFLQEGTDLAGTEADIVGISQTEILNMPPDISAPLIMRLFPSSVPVATLELTSDTLTPAELYNLAQMRIRPLLTTVNGVILPHPYGGVDMQVMVNLDRDKLLARHITPEEVHKVLRKQSMVMPGGDMKIKSTDWIVLTNSTPLKVDTFNKIPIKREGNNFVYLRDIADVQLTGRPQQNAVLVDGKQAITVVVMKTSEASTLEVVDGIREMIPRIKKIVPSDVRVKLINDASTFVRDSIADVLHELVIAAVLVSLIVLLLLGSWRPMVIVAISIPLSIMASLLCLHLFGETINVMTLGGLALAVGILVDNATVMIENVDTHLKMGKSVDEDIIDGANQIVIPTFVATLCIALVWLPMFHLSGVSGWVFGPMAEAVIFAMLASFFLTYTLVPTMAKYMLVGHNDLHLPEHGGRPGAQQETRNVFVRFQQEFQGRFERLRDRYGALLEQVLDHRVSFVFISLALTVASLGLFYFNGREFFPEIKSGTLQMHMRAPLGSRIEVSGRIASLVSNDIKEMLPGQVEDVLSNCGLPVGAHNLAFIPTPTIGPQDCDLTITLKNDKSPVWDYRRLIRKGLVERYPGTEFTFQPADLTAKILNFGSPSPIDVQVNGPEMHANYEFARQLRNELSKIPGTSDVVIQQTMRTPTLLVESKRTFGLNMNLTAKDIADNLVLSTAGSQQIDQKYWLDHKTGMSYRLNVFTPQSQLTSIKNLRTTPVKREGEAGSSSPNEKVQLLGNLANISQIGTPGVITHGNLMPMFDIYVSNEGRDLGSVLADVETVAHSMEEEMPRSAALEIHGQAETMRDAYVELLGGIIAAIVVVYLLIVINFQSWLDPFIIITALPGALAGIAWSLFLTYTNISVPAMTGAIMTMGVATANSILLVSYARERLAEHGEALRAAIEAGKARIRPVLMTASAMILGLVPMAMGNSQNMPLARAVIGGLLVATVSTLFFVPCIYAIIYERRTARQQKECI